MVGPKPLRLFLSSCEPFQCPFWRLGMARRRAARQPPSRIVLVARRQAPLQHIIVRLRLFSAHLLVVPGPVPLPLPSPPPPALLTATAGPVGRALSGAPLPLAVAPTDSSCSVGRGEAKQGQPQQQLQPARTALQRPARRRPRQTPSRPVSPALDHVSDDLRAAATCSCLAPCCS
jgi:hypothetical protein